MPDGQTHHEAWRACLRPFVMGISILAGVLMIGAAYSRAFHLPGYIFQAWIWAIVHYLLGYYIDPDWDQVSMTAAEGRSTRELGLAGVFLFGYSSFYAALMNYLARKLDVKGIAGAHQSWLTHSPIGTGIRIFFVDMPLVYVFNLAQNFALIFHLTLAGSGDWLSFLIAQAIGLGTSDLIHVYLDKRESYGRTTQQL